MAVKSVSRPSIGPPKRDSNFVRSAAETLLSWQDRWHSSSSASNTDAEIKVVCIADTHNTQPELPDGDILLHAGDLSQYGMFDEIQNQLNWLNAQPHKQKVVMAGNHDLLLDAKFVEAHPDRELEKPGKRYEDLQWGDLIYLRDSIVELEIANRKIKIFGSPLTPRFGNFAFQYDSGENVWEDRVPRDTDIFLTHGPPVGHLDDGGKGCKHLLKELWRVQPRLVVFGHIHAGRGQGRVLFNDIEECYENVILNKWPWVNLFLMAGELLWLAITRRFASGRQSNCSQLVNAAIVGGRYGRDIREPIVTCI